MKFSFNIKVSQLAILHLQLLLFFIGSSISINAQTLPKTGINDIIASVKNITEHLPVEKLHLHLDKPWYSVGDTIWFKAYLLDGSYLAASSISGLLYIELVNDSNKVVKRMMIPVNTGMSWGNLALDEKLVFQGSYTLRGYTNWMRNFGENYLFQKSFYIVNPAQPHWLVNMQAGLLQEAGEQNAHLRVQLNESFNVPLDSKRVQIKLYDDKSVLYQDAFSTNLRGMLEFSFKMPGKKSPLKLAMMLQNLQKGEDNQKIFVPLPLNRPQHTDLQFMPESGDLVDGLPAKIGFKAIGEDGKGTEISGIVYDKEAREVARFKSTHKGMGSFNLLPVAGENYTASVILPDSSTKTYPLPAAKPSGTSIVAINTEKNDSLELSILCSPDIATLHQKFFLIGQSRGVVCWGATLTLSANNTRLMISKNNFPTGIARFTLLSMDKQALNERIVFIDHHDNLNILITTNKIAYAKRDSISLNIKVTDKNGDPVQAGLSMSVTDDNQVKTDSTIEHSLVSDMLLTSDLKGTIEEPGYYVQRVPNTDSWSHLDNLLLTQGWVSYNWNTAFSPLQPPRYQAEPEFLVKGRVTNVFNKPVSNTGIILLSQKSMLVKDTSTNDSGIFTFSNIFPSDSAVFLLQARNRKGKSFNVGIEVEEFEPPVFSIPADRHLPWFVNIDTFRLSAINKEAQYKEEKDKLSGKAQLLAEVIVRAKKIIPDSKNLNGNGEADLILNASDLDKAGKQTLGMLLEKNVKGFGLGGKTGRSYVVFTMRAHLIIDGIFVEQFKPDGMSMQEYYKNFLDYYTAEDIKGIEIMRTGKYQMSYTTRFLGPLEVPWDHAFIEITTYGGKGPFMKKVPGIYLYKPLPFTLPRQFYAPKYNIDSTAGLPDIRSTIHWEPNIITDKEGKAMVSFYAADHPGFYTIIIEGGDMNGSLGDFRQKIQVKAP